MATRKPLAYDPALNSNAGGWVFDNADILSRLEVTVSDLNAVPMSDNEAAWFIARSPTNAPTATATDLMCRVFRVSGTEEYQDATVLADGKNYTRQKNGANFSAWVEAGAGAQMAGYTETRIASGNNLVNNTLYNLPFLTGQTLGTYDAYILSYRGGTSNPAPEVFYYVPGAVLRARNTEQGLPVLVPSRFGGHILFWTTTDGNIQVRSVGSNVGVVEVRGINFGGGSGSGGGGTTYTAGTGINITAANVIEIADAEAWATNTQYPRNSRVTHGGNLFEARTDIAASSTNQSPDNDTARWWQLTGGTGSGITPQQAAAIAANTAKVGLYPVHASAVGVWRGVSGNPGDSTVLSAGTAQFDGGAIYLSRTDATGASISTGDLPAVGAAINFAGISSTVSAISQNSNRIKLTMAGANQPIAGQGIKYQLFNVANPTFDQHGVYSGNTITGNGDPASPLEVAIPATNNDLNAAPTINSSNVVNFPTRTGNFTLDLSGLAGGGSASTSYAEDALHTAWTPSPFNHNAHTQTLTSGKTLVGHHGFMLIFTYTHNVTVGGTTVAATKRFAQLIDGNALRGTSNSAPLVYAIPVANHTDGGYDIVLINRVSDTSFRVQFLASDAGNTAFHEVTGVSALTLVGIHFGAGGLDSIHGVSIPAFPSS